MAADYSVAIVDLLGNTRAFVDAHDLAITTAINAGLTGTFKLDVLNAKTAEAQVASRAVKVYRNGTLVAHGKIAEPMSTDKDWTTVSFADPFYWLQFRTVQSAASYNNTDAGSIAWDLVSTQEARGATRLRQGSITTSVKRDRDYEVGKAVSEAITELAEVDRGFFFRIDPVDGAPGTHGELVILYPDAGQDRPAAKFEFGTGTVANLSTFGEEVRAPRNYIVATGNGPRATAQDAASIATYDLIEDSLSLNDVKRKNTLRQHANAALIPEPVSTYTVEPTSKAPMLWDSFTIGDTVRLTIHHGRVQVSDLPVRVNAVTVNVTDDGTETLSDMVLEAV